MFRIEAVFGWLGCRVSRLTSEVYLKSEKGQLQSTIVKFKDVEVMKITRYKKNLIMLSAAFTASAFAQNNSGKASNLLAVALPSYAAVASYLKDDQQGLVQLIQSEAVTLGVVEVLKSSINKTRPDGSDSKSFPSGHSAVAFSAAQYLQMKGGWEYGAPAYAAASYVAYARVDAKKHYWSDVVAGGAIGAITTYALTDSTSGNRLSMVWVPGAASVVWQQPLK